MKWFVYVLVGTPRRSASALIDRPERSRIAFIFSETPWFSITISLAHQRRPVCTQNAVDLRPQIEHKKACHILRTSSRSSAASVRWRVSPAFPHRPLAVGQGVARSTTNTSQRSLRRGLRMALPSNPPTSSRQAGTLPQPILEAATRRAVVPATCIGHERREWRSCPTREAGTHQRRRTTWNFRFITTRSSTPSRR